MNLDRLEVINMKERPRRAEREVSDHLTRFFVPLGHDPVERIPVLGRTGPDITINGFGLVVDVKSRLECPKSYMGISLPFVHIVSDQTVAVRMRNIHLLADRANLRGSFVNGSITVKRWLDHMDEWRKQEYPDGISAIVLHRPKLPFGDSVVVIYFEDLGRFHDRYYHSLQCLNQSRSLIPAGPVGQPV
jgi:hypothetical protein